MLIQDTCPKCGGLAMVVGDTVSCSLCGESPQETGGGVVLNSLLEETPREDPAKVFLDLSQEVPSDFPRERLEVLVPQSMVSNGPDRNGRDYDPFTERAVEFYVHFVAGYGALPKMEPLVEGAKFVVDLVSSHAFLLEELCRANEIAKEELVSQALRLYIRESSECQAD